MLWAHVCRSPRVASLAASLGHLGLQGAGQIEVPPDGIVVGAGAKRHKQVPDGVGEGDPSVALEEHGADAVEGASGHQLPDALGVRLSARARVGHRSEEQPATSRAPGHRPYPPQTKRPHTASQPELSGGVSTPGGHWLSPNQLSRVPRFYHNLTEYFIAFLSCLKSNTSGSTAGTRAGTRNPRFEAALLATARRRK